MFGLKVYEKEYVENRIHPVDGSHKFLMTMNITSQKDFSWYVDMLEEANDRYRKNRNLRLRRKRSYSNI